MGTLPQGFLPALPSLPSKMDFSLNDISKGAGLSRTSSVAHSVTNGALPSVAPSSMISMTHPSPRARHHGLMPTSSFFPVSGPCGERFAESFLERDMRSQPAPGDYGNPVGIGQAQKSDSTHRSQRASSFGPPVKPPGHGGPSHRARRHGTNSGVDEQASARVQKRLAKHIKGMHALASMWDLDRDGLVGRRELQRGLLLFGLSLSEADLDILFRLYDKNNDGGIDLVELETAVVSGGLGHIAEEVAQEIEIKSPARRTGTKALGKFQLRQVEGGESVQEQLRNALTKQAVRVIDLFREWDTSMDGLIQLEEFEKGIERLGYMADPESVAGLFHSWDADGSGAISLFELNKILRRGGVIKLRKSLTKEHAQRKKIEVKRKADALASKIRRSLNRRMSSDLRPSAALNKEQEKLLRKLSQKRDKLITSLNSTFDGIITKKELAQILPVLGIAADENTICDLFDTMDYNSSGKVPISHLESALLWSGNSGSSGSGIIKLVFTDDRPLHEQLRDALAGEANRVIDLFRSWDENNDGFLSREEFRRALPMLGISVPRGVQGIDEMFEAFDGNGNGRITFREFNKLLRRDTKSDEERKTRNKKAAGPDLEIVTLDSVRKEVARDVARLQVALEEADRKAAKAAKEAAEDD